jgi:tRNA 2-thiouridine synthesizing protein A
MDRITHPSYLAVMSDIADTLDAIGLLCPLPVLKARKRLKSIPAGAVLEILADDPAAVIDVPHFCNEAGHEFLGLTEADSHQIYRIRKAG